jgi:hypothetical protein
MLEDPNDLELLFDNLSMSITMIPELHPSQIPTYSEVLLLPEDDLADPKPDLVIEAFTKRAKAAELKANKVLMQDEVDEPVSYCDYGSEFLPQSALIPHRPWLMPSLSIILPLTHLAIRHADSEMNDGHILYSDQLDIPKLDMNSDIRIPDSDEIPDHINIPHSDDISDDINIPHSETRHQILIMSFFLNLPSTQDSQWVVRV